MRTVFCWSVLAGFFLCCPSEAPAADSDATLLSLQPITASILKTAQAGGDASFQRLGDLCDLHGPRPTGSTNLESAIDWVLDQLKKDGFSNVHGEAVTVPHWVRGQESAELLEPRSQPIKILGVGGSVATPPEGIIAGVLVVRDFSELKQRATEARGKIVVFNLPFTEYGTTVAIRTRGAVEASRVGAVASLIRSVGPFSMKTPHTGMMQYDPTVPPIPHAAITLEDAALLQRMQDRGQTLRLQLRMSSNKMADAVSRNVVADLPGRESPKEIVLLSAHIDSWDVGQGAMDDAGGCIAAWEAVRLIHRLKLQPRRTLRVVLWTGEENGIWGAKAYRKLHSAELADHVLAMESDRGVFAPEGFAFTGSDRAMGYIKVIAGFLEPLHASKITLGNGGMDVMELLQEGVPSMDLVVDRSRYFWFHHSEADTVDKLNAAELNQCVGALAVMSFCIAEMPVRLPR